MFLIAAVILVLILCFKSSVSSRYLILEFMIHLVFLIAAFILVLILCFKSADSSESLSSSSYRFLVKFEVVCNFFLP